jgi:hypothetical protein
MDFFPTKIEFLVSQSFVNATGNIIVEFKRIDPLYFEKIKKIKKDKKR